MVCKLYNDVGGGINKLYHVCLPVRKIIHSLKLLDYLHVQVVNPWYNYYLGCSNQLFISECHVQTSDIDRKKQYIYFYLHNIMTH